MEIYEEIPDMNFGDTNQTPKADNSVSNSESVSEVQIVTPPNDTQTTTPEKGWMVKVMTPIAKSILYFSNGIRNPIPIFREIYNQEANTYINLNTPQPRQLFNPFVASTTTPGTLKTMNESNPDLNTPEKRRLWMQETTRKLEQKLEMEQDKSYNRYRKRKYTNYAEDADDMELAHSFKLYPPDIQPFSGNTEDWAVWKMNTVTRLGGRGYRKLLFDKEFDKLSCFLVYYGMELLFLMSL